MDEQVAGIAGASRADAEALTRALAAAFEDDPIFGWLLPDRRRRYDRLLRFFALELEDVVLPAGTVWMSPEGSGACLELPPGAWRMPLRTQARHAPRFVAVFDRSLPTVRTLFAVLRRPLGEQEPAVDAATIAGKVIEAIPVKTSAVSGEIGLAASIFDAGSYATDVGEFLGPVGASLDIASELTEEGGQPASEWQIQAAADRIGGLVRERLQKMTGELGVTEEIIDSDWGKLSTTATEAGSKWGVNQRELTAATSTIELGISQWMWTAIAPAAYNLVEVRNVPEGSGRQIYCFNGAGENPWEDASPESIFYPLAGFEAGRARSTEAFGILSGGFESIQSSPTPVSEALGEKMFGTPSEGGAALLAPTLLERAHWSIEEAKSEKISGRFGPELPVGWCGLLES